METYRRIVIIIAVFVSITFLVFFISLDMPRMAITNPVTEDDFEYLKERSFKVCRSVRY